SGSVAVPKPVSCNSLFFPDAESYLVDGLQNENLSAKAREQRDAILFGFQQVKSLFPLLSVNLGAVPAPDLLHVGAVPPVVW
uniref:Src kinase associated phosphoprotein 1 n=1 Tax=Nothoprocta perdicaria TaxID=30464 RepID=A0A8C6ZLY4_NOTPE